MVNPTFIFVTILVAVIIIAYITRNTPVYYGGGYGPGYYGPSFFGGYGGGGGPTIVVNDFDSNGF